MFDRFIRLAQARKALHDGRFEEAARLASDPLIAGDRRAQDLRKAAQDALAKRGRERLLGGDPAAALRDLERAIAVADHSQATSDLDAAKAQLAANVDRLRSAQIDLDRAHKAAERGQLQVAEVALALVAGEPKLVAAAAALQSFVVHRRAEAHRLVAAAEAALADGKTADAEDRLRAARAWDDSVGSSSLVKAVVKAAGAALGSEIDAELRSGTPRSALAKLQRRLQQLPELAALPVATNALREVATAVLSILGDSSRTPDLELLQTCVAGPLPPLASVPSEWTRVEAAAPLLLRLPSVRTEGRPTESAAILEQLAELLDRDDFRSEAADLVRRATAAREQVQRARAHAAIGEFDAARALLAKVLEDMPMHDEARSERDAIDRSARDREQRLQAAREAARQGRLKEAYALALAEAQGGTGGNAAAMFVQELRARIDLVGRGIDEVRAALHGRTSGGLAGLRHCLSRLEELAKVQCDHDDLPQLQRALASEVEGIEQAEAAGRAFDAGNVESVVVAIDQLCGRRASLLAADRLDARILSLVDRLKQRADHALLGGRLREVEVCARGIRAAVAVDPVGFDTAERLLASCSERRQRAEQLATEAEKFLAERDLRGAESRCEAARQMWVDGACVAKIEAELAGLRQQEAALARVEAMKRGGDLSSAHVAMESMPPTPPMLRTRIYDMKKSLAQAQGLEGAFLLRVDEGGEFVVLRGESISIGNLRDGTADLPILAAIAGKHARIQRSMSFHGGMQDTLHAEGGEVRVRGQKVAQHALRPGDKFQLGSALHCTYQIPCKRSLTAMLQVHGGFQIAGTDRVLLLKDRGRDGRICLGPGADVHIRVSAATAEVELFGTKIGQIRVRCAAGGDIDGVPFR
ncbi:MAG: hypothetical protein ABL997_00550, partial [Planctomycetota bacterium]